MAYAYVPREVISDKKEDPVPAVTTMPVDEKDNISMEDENHGFHNGNGNGIGKHNDGYDDEAL